MNRRAIISLSLAGFPAILQAAGTAPLDDAMQSLLERYGIPGGALGIARAGRIAYAQGFGFANREQGTAATADSRFRIASCSKPITAAAVLRLIEQGKLALDEAVLPKLNMKPLDKLGDSRWNKITVRHLLQHTGGWRKSASGDAMFKSPQICAETGIEAPADAKTTVRWMLSRPLDFEPGSDYSYCNFGYCLLGRLIESVTGSGYGNAVNRLVLGPSKATGMALGRSLTALHGEVTYYQSGTAPSVYPHLGSRAPWPYGTFSLEANDANGGWVSSVNDMLRFLMAMDEHASKPLLTAASLQALYDSAAPGSGSGGAYQGLGWLVRPQGQGGRPNLWHIGGLPGTKSIAVRLGDGFDWCVFFNSRPGSGVDSFDAFNTEVQNTIHQAARKVTTWP